MVLQFFSVKILTKSSKIPIQTIAMSTKKLAKELGLLRQRSQSGSKKSVISNQMFSYLIVIDFESTCWREKNNYSQEIIEFPAVMLNTATEEVESEFHTYVQPQEHPILSEFCTELTGITQIQVEAGIPLQICLSQFSRWLQNLQFEKGLVFPSKERCSAPLPSQKLCTFLTWSDWDLGVCLQYECKRKQLHKPDVLNNWIDLRSTYRLFYSRKPKGLNGALQDLGIQFSGREHSGLDDARNTAQLAARMMRDGCVMKITRSLERTPVVVKPMFGSTSCPASGKKEKLNTNEKEGAHTTSKPSSSKISLKVCEKQSRSEDSTMNLDTKENSKLVQESVQICQSLISPKTVLSDTTAPRWGNSRSSVTSETAAVRSSSVMINYTSPHNNNNNSLVLCSTTVSCFSNLPEPNQTSKTGITFGLQEEKEGANLLVETEERCGSYDDVVLESDEVINATDRECDADCISDFDSGRYEWEDPDNAHSPGRCLTLKDNVIDKVIAGNNSKMQNIIRDSSTTCKSTKMPKSHVIVSPHLNVITQHPTTSESDTFFAVPKTVTQRKSNQSMTRPKNSLQLQEKSHGPHITNTSSLLGPKPFVPDKTSTPSTSFARPKPIITKHKQKSSFKIYTEPEKQTTAPSGLSSSRLSLHTSTNVLSSLSTNTLSSCTRRSSISLTLKGAQKITSPLCGCGRRAKRQIVSNGGPNHGRGFYCCPVRRSGSSGRVEKGCDFFKWESALMKSSSVAAPAVGSSVSLCQSYSTFPHRLQHRSGFRKSY